jgi:hypothetical protein
MPDRWQMARLLLRAAPARIPSRFGLRQALASAVAGSVEWMDRHLRILRRLEDLRRWRGASRLDVLDFGGAEGGLAKTVVLHGLAHRYRIVVADVDAEALRIAPRSAPVALRVRLGPEAGLPFPDRAFDVAVSSDVFEHVPPSWRAHWALELGRVSRFGQLHTVPCSSEDGRFAGRDADERFQRWHLETFGRADVFTSQHQEHGLPSPAELARLFPGARLAGFANTEVWLQCMRDQFRRTSRPARVLNGLAFLRRHGRAEHPPFKNCLVDALQAPLTG